MIGLIQNQKVAATTRCLRRRHDSFPRYKSIPLIKVRSNLKIAI